MSKIFFTFNNNNIYPIFQGTNEEFTEYLAKESAKALELAKADLKKYEEELAKVNKDAFKDKDVLSLDNNGIEELSKYVFFIKKHKALESHIEEYKPMTIEEGNYFSVTNEGKKLELNVQ